MQPQNSVSYCALFPVFQTGTTTRIVSCEATVMTDNDDECLTTRALREGLRREIGQKPAHSSELNAEIAIRS